MSRPALRSNFISYQLSPLRLLSENCCKLYFQKESIPPSKICQSMVQEETNKVAMKKSKLKSAVSCQDLQFPKVCDMEDISIIEIVMKGARLQRKRPSTSAAFNASLSDSHLQGLPSTSVRDKALCFFVFFPQENERFNKEADEI